MAWRQMNATERKDAIVAAIAEMTEEVGYPPLRAELAAHCGMDLKTIRRYLLELLTEGRVAEPGGSRTLRVVEPDRRVDGALLDGKTQKKVKPTK